MQEKNIIANTYWADNERFADIMNVGLFQKKVLTAEQLSERDGYLGRVKQRQKESDLQRNRDVTKKSAFGTNFVIVSAENQDSIHYAMPVRIMGYEFMEYNRQLKELKALHDKKKDLYGAEFLSGLSADDKLHAVCTLVIYYGKEPWTGSTCLTDMLDFSEIPEEIRDIVADYPIHVIDARRFEDSEKLETEARLFFGMLQRDEDADSWQEYVNENKEGFQILSTDTYDAIATFTKMGQMLDTKEMYEDENGGCDMCKAMEDLIARGEARGEVLGENRILMLIQKMTTDEMLDQIPRITTDTEFCKEMLKKYNIS